MNSRKRILAQCSRCVKVVHDGIQVIRQVIHSSNFSSTDTIVKIWPCNVATPGNTATLTLPGCFKELACQSSLDVAPVNADKPVTIRPVLLMNGTKHM